MTGRVLLLDVVGLTPSLVGSDTPNLAAVARDGAMVPLECPFPALTCSSQASLLTGKTPTEHGIVGNGWYFRELQEVWLWRQSHALVESEDIHARVLRERPGTSVARLFLWYAMGAAATWCVTPRPQYRADGRKVPDVWSHPADLRDELQGRLGRFPLFQFWGPGAGLRSSEWIVASALHVWETRRPTLESVYVPHLDYDFQRYGPDDPRSRAAVRDVDRILGPLIARARGDGATVLVVSEYGIDAVDAPIHPNRILREHGLLAVREENGRELLDPVASAAFAVADHQIAHVYVKDRPVLPDVKRLFESLRSIDRVLDSDGRRAEGIDHARAGDLVLVAARNAWFTYYYWMDDAHAPDFARCVEIHRKPGYDPAELFFDPKRSFPKAAAAAKLLARAAGLRSVLDLVGLDPTIVRGSHGRRTSDPARGPILLSSRRDLLPDGEPFPIAAFQGLVLSAIDTP